jgi:hypothetical protein
MERTIFAEEHVTFRAAVRKFIEKEIESYHKHLRTGAHSPA